MFKSRHYILAFIVCCFLACNNGNDITKQTPVATDFTIGNLKQTVGNISPVTIVPLSGKSTGTIAIYYNNSFTLPVNAGEYLVTFNVAATTYWNEANRLNAGMLSITQASGNFGTPDVININFSESLTLANLSLPEGYTWDTPETTLNAGTDQSFPVTFTHPSGNYESAKGYITVNVLKVDAGFGDHSSINVSYTPTLILANLSLEAGYTWDTPEIALNAGDNQLFPAIFTHPSGNFNSASGYIVVNVAKAIGNFGSPDAINTTYIAALTLTNLILEAGYAWNAPATFLTAGANQLFPATFTHSSGNYESANGNIIVNVAKAIGNFGSHDDINTIYTTTLTLENLILETGYTWDIPATALNAGNNQIFPATFIHPSGNYEIANGNITVNVEKSGPSAWPTSATITYGMPLSSSTLSGGDTASGSFSWTNSIIFPTVINTGYDVTFTPNDTANYVITIGRVPITVDKAIGGVVNPIVSGYTHNGILLEGVTVSTGQNVEYAISTSNNANTAVWQTGLIFTGLSSGTNYYIFARSIENENYNTGLSSDSIQVTTRLSDILTVTNEVEWNNALALINTFGNGTEILPQTFTITISGAVSISGSTSASFGTVSNLIVTINGNGSLTLTSRGRIITATNNQRIIIDSGNLTLQGYSSNNTSLISIGTNSTLELRNGTISNNINTNTNASAFGGGVSCSGNFIMSGGTISNNYAGIYIRNSGSSFSGLGGGIYCTGTFTMTAGSISNNMVFSDAINTTVSANPSAFGGGVYFSGTDFNISGGNINNNESLASIYSGSGTAAGGGVYFSGTNLNMTGGNMSDNISRSFTTTISTASSSSYGGGLYFANGSFTLDGGSINNNTTSSNNNSSNAFADGGGVYFVNGLFSMKAGEINNNTATSSNSLARGGGVYINNTFTMTGGTVSGNKSITYGGGIFISNNSNSSFVKTGGNLFGNDAVVVSNRNTVIGSNPYGHAVYYDLLPGFYRDTSLGTSDDLYSTAPLPPNSGQSLSGWTRR